MPLRSSAPFLFNIAVVSCLVTAVLVRIVNAESGIQLDPLPYGSYSALEPYISARTLAVHHDRHHAKYVRTTNDMIAGTDLEGMSLEEIMQRSKDRGDAVLYNNAAQSWNHDFYWKCMRDGGPSKPTPRLLSLIEDSFGSYDAFVQEFGKAGNTAFGSGWAWLVCEKSSGKLLVTKTTGAENPLTIKPDEWVPLLTMDVWEHAYYLDYENKRDAYVTTFIEKLINWDFVDSNLQAAIGGSDNGAAEL